jgi:S1-C subfamily serine protease
MFAEISENIAEVVARVAPSVVQVEGRRRRVSGVVYAPGIVLSTTRALGRDDTARIRRHDGTWFAAELAGWDVATQLAVLKVEGLDVPAVERARREARTGQLAVSVARSWSNAVTASVGNVAIIGGPLPTGPRRGIERIIRTTAPMHDGFSGGAFVDPAGQLAGITTAAAIRGLGIVIPADIAYTTAETIVKRGGFRRSYLGLAGQSVRLPETQRLEHDAEEALLVVAVTPGSPAAAAGVLVGDLLLEFAGRPLVAPEDLLTLLMDEPAGREVALRIRRGTQTIDVRVTLGERPARNHVS